MEIRLTNRDRLTIPEGCKATVNGNEIVIEKGKQEFKDGDIVTIDKNTICIFKETQNKGVAEFYAGISDNEIYIPENPNGYIYCPIGELTLSTEDEKQFLFDKMKEKCLRWNAEKKRVEKVRWRAEKNGVYWSIISCTVPMSENNEADDQNYYDSGNYFRTREQAERAAEAVKETLRKFHDEND